MTPDVNDYDDLPYESIAFPETHPDSLATLGRLLGIATAAPERCRVLELGCASAGNLVPMAVDLPDSAFVGVDLSQRQIDGGRRLIAELGLTNIDLVQGDIRQLDERLGRFDFIVAHGVLSWVPDETRNALFDLYRRLLQPNGIGYLSYNTLPGWQGRAMLREMLRYHTRGLATAQQRLEAAQAFVELYAKVLERQASAPAQHLLQELQALHAAHPSYLYHEYLEADNRPLLFSEFVELAAAHGLHFLCECQLESMFPADFGEPAEGLLERLDDTAEHQQYLDFFNLRTFRQSLVVHAALEPDYEIDLERLTDFACAADLRPPARVRLRAGQAQAFTDPAGRQVWVEHPLLKALLVLLHERYPSAPALRTLLPEAAQRMRRQRGTTASGATDGWQAELFRLYAGGQVRLSERERLYPASSDPRPRLNALSRALLKHGARHIPAAWHQSLTLDPFAERLLVYLDGGHDRQALLERLAEDIAQHRLQVPGLSDDPAHRRTTLRANIDRLLTLFARNGVLEAEADGTHAAPPRIA